MNLWPVEHFFPHFLTGLLCTQIKPVKKWGKKCSTGQRFICTELTSYKIHTLIVHTGAPVYGRQASPRACHNLTSEAAGFPRKKLNLVSLLQMLLKARRFINATKLFLKWSLNNAVPKIFLWLWFFKVIQIDAKRHEINKMTIPKICANDRKSLLTTKICK